MAVKVRKFEGPSLESLLEHIRVEAGPEARITQADRVRKGGVGGFFAREHFAITVAVEEPGVGSGSAATATTAADRLAAAAAAAGVVPTATGAGVSTGGAVTAAAAARRAVPAGVPAGVAAARRAVPTGVPAGVAAARRAVPAGATVGQAAAAPAAAAPAAAAPAAAAKAGRSTAGVPAGVAAARRAVPAGATVGQSAPVPGDRSKVAGGEGGRLIGAAGAPPGGRGERMSVGESLRAVALPVVAGAVGLRAASAGGAPARHRPARTNGLARAGTVATAGPSATGPSASASPTPAAARPGAVSAAPVNGSGAQAGTVPSGASPGALVDGATPSGTTRGGAVPMSAAANTYASAFASLSSLADETEDVVEMSSSEGRAATGSLRSGGGSNAADPAGATDGAKGSGASSALGPFGEDVAFGALGGAGAFGGGDAFGGAGAFGGDDAFGGAGALGGAGAFGENGDAGAFRVPDMLDAFDALASTHSSVSTESASFEAALARVAWETAGDGFEDPASFVSPEARAAAEDFATLADLEATARSASPEAPAEYADPAPLRLLPAQPPTPEYVAQEPAPVGEWGDVPCGDPLVDVLPGAGGAADLEPFAGHGQELCQALLRTGLPAGLLPSGAVLARMVDLLERGDVRGADGLGLVLARVFDGLVPAPELPVLPGSVLVVVGEGRRAMSFARGVADEIGLDPTETPFATTETRTLPRTPARLQVRSADAATELAPAWRRSPLPTVVVLDAPLAGANRSWARHVLGAIRPTAIWGVVEATVKPEDVSAWSNDLGGFDALVVQGVGSTVSPASVLATEIPVARLGERKATPAEWAALVAERLARCS